MNKIAKYLNQHIVGNVFDKPSILEAYSTDRSILKITPRFVAVPYNTDDIRRLVRFSNQLAEKGFSLPITVRGSGLDTTGADLGSGLVISMEKFTDILEIDERSRLVRVQAGVTLEKLNAVLAAHGMTLPVHLNPKDTIGSLIANFPTDPTTKKHGNIYYYVDRLEAVLANGDCVQTANVTLRGLNKAKGLPDFEGTVYRDLDDLLNDEFDTVEDLAEEDSSPRGYQMISQVFNARRRSFDLLPLFFASQGTLGIITEVILRAEPLSREVSHLAVGFESVRPAIDFLNLAAEFRPLALDLYDAQIFQTAAEHGKELDILNPLIDHGYYIVASFNDSPFRTRQKLKKLLKDLPDSATIAIETPENTNDFTELTAALQSYLNDDLLGERTPLVDNAYVSAEQLPNFLVALKSLAETYDFDLPVYGSFTASHYTVRPELDLGSVDGRQTTVRFLKDYASLLKDHDGFLIGSGAEGRIKAAFTNRDLDQSERELYDKVKKIFDPNNILNPEVKLGATRETLVRHLRTTPYIGVTTE